jgi:hypothetical protein
MMEKGTMVARGQILKSVPILYAYKAAVFLGLHENVQCATLKRLVPELLL